MAMLLYPDEIAEVYRRQAEWNKQFALNAIELGVDMIHVSDDWGAQKSLMFSPQLWRELIYPNHKITADAVKKAGAFLSLHSDGCVETRWTESASLVMTLSILGRSLPACPMTCI